MRGKNPASGTMPPLFGLPPAIQKMSPKQASAWAAESALVALELLMNSTRPLRPTSSMRCASPGNDPQARLDRAQVEAERERGRRGAGGVLRIVATAQRVDGAEPGDLGGGAAGGLQDAVVLDIDAVGERPAHRHAHHLRPACSARSATAWHQSSSTPTTAVPPGCTPWMSRSLTAA